MRAPQSHAIYCGDGDASICLNDLLAIIAPEFERAAAGRSLRLVGQSSRLFLYRH
jgi:hypothetical protein